jgi:ribonuclease HI
VSDSVERILAAIAALSDEDRARLFERLTSEAGFPPASQAPMSLDISGGELEDPPDYTLIFDGGSQGNPGPGYGSYVLVRGQDGKQDLTRLDFGRQMTSNEAEYETLIAGLQGLIERLESTGQVPGDTTVEIRGDSALVIHQVEGTWKTKDGRMRSLRNRARGLLARLKCHRLVLQPREASVRVLGH